MSKMSTYDTWKCDGNHCDRKERCLRYLAPPADWWRQSWIFAERRGDECEYFISADQVNPPLTDGISG